MPYLNVKERVLEAKIVYYGAGLSGKTTNLEQVQSLTNDGQCGDMMSLNTDGDRTLFFDWLPFHMGKFKGCDIKVQLYTVPGQSQYAETRRRVLVGADGVVLVLDSDPAALEKNKQTVKDLRAHLQESRLEQRVPVLVQLNKRDLPQAMDPSKLMRAVGLDDSPHVEAAALKGDGVLETLKEVTRLVLESVRSTAKSTGTLKSGPVSALDGNTLYESLTADPPKASNGRAQAKAQAKAKAPTSAKGASVGMEVPRVPKVAKKPVAPPKSTTSANKKAPAARKRVVDTPLTKTPAAKKPATSTDSRIGASTQLAEVIAGQRVLQQRLDALTGTMENLVAGRLAELERGLMAKFRAELTKSMSSIENSIEKLPENSGIDELRTGVDSVAHGVRVIHETVTATRKELGGLERRIARAQQQETTKLDGLQESIDGLTTRLEEEPPKKGWFRR